MLRSGTKLKRCELCVHALLLSVFFCIKILFSIHHCVSLSACFFLHYLECPSGAFKSSIDNTKCDPCPQKSVSNAGRTTCTCVEGFYKSFDADCEGITNSSVIQHLIMLHPSFFFLGSLPVA